MFCKELSHILLHVVLWNRKVKNYYFILYWWASKNWIASWKSLMTYIWLLWLESIVFATIVCCPLCSECWITAFSASLNHSWYVCDCPVWQHGTVIQTAWLTVMDIYPSHECVKGTENWTQGVCTDYSQPLSLPFLGQGLSKLPTLNLNL